VDAVDEGEALLLAPARDRFVGQDHELLDEPVAGQPRAVVQADRVAGGVQLDDRLGEVEVDGPPLHPAPGEQFGDLGHLQQVGDYLLVLHLRGRSPPLDDRLGMLVSQAGLRVDDRVGQFGLQRPALGVQADDAGEGQAVLVWAQGAGLVGEGLREHGDHPSDQVDAGPPFPRFGVEGRVGPHVVGDVGDVHPHRPAVVVTLDADGVIEVLGVGRVDGDDRLLPQVPTGGDDLGQGFRTHPGRLGFDLGGEVLGQSGPADEGGGLDLGVVGVPQHLGHLPPGTAVLVPPALDPHDHQVVVLGLDHRGGIDQDVGFDLGVLGHHEPAGAVPHQITDQRLVGVPQDALDPALQPLLPAGDDLHLDPVAVQGPLGGVGPHEDVLVPPFGLHEEVVVAGGRDDAGDHVETLGGRVAIAADVHDPALADQFAERGTEGGIVFFRDLESAGELAYAQRAAGLFAQVLQDLFFHRGPKIRLRYAVSKVRTA
jgi:hypothetical protein